MANIIDTGIERGTFFWEKRNLKLERIIYKHPKNENVNNHISTPSEFSVNQMTTYQVIIIIFFAATIHKWIYLLQETEPKYSNFSLRCKYINNRGHFSETLGILYEYYIYSHILYIFIKPNFRRKYQTSSSGQKFFGKKCFVIHAYIYIYIYKSNIHFFLITKNRNTDTWNDDLAWKSELN